MENNTVKITGKIMETQKKRLSPGNLLVFERKAGSRASSRNKSENHGNDTE